MALQGDVLNNNTPSTGFGGFNLQLVPVVGGDNILNVILNVYVIPALGPGGSAGPSGAEINTFIGDWRGMINGFWGDKIIFSSGTERLKVRFIINQVNNYAASHFPVLLSPCRVQSGLNFVYAGPGGDPAGLGVVGAGYLRLGISDTSRIL